MVKYTRFWSLMVKTKTEAKVGWPKMDFFKKKSVFLSLSIAT
jgi:hypothetical protein